MATERVDTTDGLFDAIQRLGDGDTIDATECKGNNRVPSGTLDGEGVTVVTNSRKKGFLRIEQEGTVVRNLDLAGHVHEAIEQDGYWDYPDGDDAWAHAAEGISIQASDAVVENVTCRGWTHAGILVGTNNGPQFTPTIRNCRLVKNNCRGLGYGVVVYSGHPVIEKSYLNQNRHDIAGGIWEGVGYTSRYNHIGPNGRIYSHESHPPGGRRFHIHHNTFEDKWKTFADERCTLVRNRGTPSDHGLVERNWFKGRQVVDVNDGYTFRENHEGPDDPGPDIGQPRDPTADKQDPKRDRGPNRKQLQAVAPHLRAVRADLGTVDAILSNDG